MKKSTERYPEDSREDKKLDEKLARSLIAHAKNTFGATLSKEAALKLVEKAELNMKPFIRK